MSKNYKKTDGKFLCSNSDSERDISKEPKAEIANKILETLGQDTYTNDYLADICSVKKSQIADMRSKGTLSFKTFISFVESFDNLPLKLFLNICFQGVDNVLERSERKDKEELRKVLEKSFEGQDIYKKKAYLYGYLIRDKKDYEEGQWEKILLDAEKNFKEHFRERFFTSEGKIDSLQIDKVAKGRLFIEGKNKCSLSFLNNQLSLSEGKMERVFSTTSKQKNRLSVSVYILVSYFFKILPQDFLDKQNAAGEDIELIRELDFYQMIYGRKELKELIKKFIESE